ncbi:interleukin-1 receptor-associated kinase 4-like [Lingula anatina]|uniref:non-specific serine/threonine protein kinase n=1 Tax=Lingula anatina TaxID=7574 RepID=A0A1S3K6J7_LINAN|nr:interleukin-1 receptor-associated kinase 4-like [Lingula anatina]|eukprot:XP_013418258.1 interleukin-1 receptor-associated kinase 4-like [Lingula anatina]
MNSRRDLTVQPTTLVRCMRYSHISQLCQLLDPDQAWKHMTDYITKPNGQPKYNFDTICMLEMEVQRPNGSPTRKLIEDWSTQNTTVKDLLDVLVKSKLYRAANFISVDVLKGDKIEENEIILYDKNDSVGSLPCPGPTESSNLGHLNIELGSVQSSSDSNNFSNDNSNSGSIRVHRLDHSSFGGPAENSEGKNLARCPSENDSSPYLASEEVNQMISLKNDVENGKGLDVEQATDPYCSQETVLVGAENEEKKDTQAAGDDMSSLIQDIVEGLEHGDSVKHFEYSKLKLITGNFNRTAVSEKGNFLGQGGFGEVYLGKPDSIHLIAVKRLMDRVDTVMKQFKTELQVLSKYRHKNLLPLLGYSSDGPQFCIVFEYMPNGSVEDRLACKENTPPLSVEQRLEIVKGTARGIVFLHTFDEKPLIHRDIKSANILLDCNMVPKVGDFGFARTGSANPASMKMTTTVIGTSAYMAPEAVKFDISIKLDTFSYGVVLLELLSGLPPFDEEREEKDLASYVDENYSSENALELADRTAGEWPESVFNSLFSTAVNCLNYKKKLRPTMQEVLQEIEDL